MAGCSAGTSIPSTTLRTPIYTRESVIEQRERVREEERYLAELLETDSGTAEVGQTTL